VLKVLVTGGAGYIGTTLVPLLLESGYYVTVYDNIMYNGDVLIPFFRNKKFSFIKGDVRDPNQIREACHGMDVVIHLAAIVGYGACRKDEKLAYDVNVGGTRAIIDSLNPDQYLIYASTGSNYGILNEICTESSPLNPMSVYGKTKTEGESIVINGPIPFTAFRFATAFGLSPRLRLDLLINELTYIAAKQKYLVIYESHFMRTFIHVYDIARSFLFAIDHRDSMNRQIYNVGSNKMNLSKRDVCEIISKHTDVYIHYADYDGDADKRNYVVSYEKINSLGYETTISVDEGIQELLSSRQVLNIANHYVNS
jgi:nucleoside-diphosphate-sugar epimerase